MLPDFRVRQRDYLLEIAYALTQELDLSKLLHRILTISIEMLAGQGGLIALREMPSGWRIAASNQIPSPLLEYIQPLLASIPEDQDPERFELPEINRLLKEVSRIASFGLLSGVAIPLVARNQVIGVIFIFRSYSDLFSSNDRNLLRSFANQAAVAVSNAKLYETTLQEKQRMDALLDSTADGILILRSNHTIERANQAFLRMYGSSAEKVIDKPHEQIISWHNTPQGLTLEKAEAGGWPLTPNATLYVEGDLKRPNLNPLPVGITYSPLISSEGRLMNIIATARDISRFREADELKSTFISIISHELKTPVALIKGYVSTLRREDASWDKTIVKNSLAIIEEEADHLTDLIENLLDATRLQAGGVKLKRTDLSLYSLVNRLAERFRTQTQQHTIIVDIPEDFPIILADETRISQVISNLLSNAIKYSPGGVVRLVGQVRSEQVILCVSDEGPGIAAEDIPHIFDRFYRAPSAARNTKGAGLGLFLTRAIIEAHGGKIWVDPKPDSGARICFSLPRTAEI